MSKLYRFEDYMDEDGSLGVRMTSVQVISETPQGYWYSWSDFMPTDKKWTSKTGARRKWCDNREDALSSYKYRKQHELRFVTARLRKVKGILAHLDSVNPNDTTTFSDRGFRYLTLTNIHEEYP